jgi:MFS family permease
MNPPPQVFQRAITSTQIRGFLAAWGGLTLDGMDSFIYALVLVPAVRDLLPRSGIAATLDAIGYYGGLLFALFLIGWGLSFIWGPIGDRFGRKITLMLTILCFSLFTFLGALATNIWMLAFVRLMSGVGIGGAWTMGSIFIAEEWPEEWRARVGGYMHTGYYLGMFLASLANYVVGSHYGWRAMFFVGGIPALFVGFIQFGVQEPQRWTHRIQEFDHRRTLSRPFLTIFSPEYRGRTLVNALFLLVSITGLWAGSVYVPASVTQLATQAGLSAAAAARLASQATMLLAVGTVLGCLLAPWLADRIGRRLALGAFFALMFAAIASAFGWAFYLERNALTWFIVILFFLGIGGGNFAMYTLWLPEQYRTECRASAFGFVTSAGRFVGAGITFLVGAAVAHFHTIGFPVAATSAAFVLGLTLLPFAIETKGKPLPK